MASSSIVIRQVQGREDCEAIVNLTAICFPQEAKCTGMPAHKWRDLHTDELLRNPLVWEQCGKIYFFKHRIECSNS